MTLEPIEPSEPRKTGHRWVDLFVAFSALFISALSIFMGQQTGASMEKLVHASSWPFVQLGTGNATPDGDLELSFGAQNVGTGPARVHAFSMMVDGEPLPDGHLLTNLLNACCAEDFRAASEAAGDNIAAIGYEVSSPIGSRFLATNEEVYAIRWRHSEANNALWRKVDEARQQGRITMSVCYCSVFDECWVARTDTFPPDEVASCTADQARTAAR